MTDSTWIALALAVLAIGLLVVDQIRDRRKERLPLLAQRVIVQLVDGSAVAGVLTRRVGAYYVVEHGRLLENGTEIDVDGAAWLPVARVNWIQSEGSKL